VFEAGDIEQAWAAWDLARRRAAVDWAMVVRVLPVKTGRRPGGSYWDPSGVWIEWRER
jgi:hypothetical protein